MTQDDIDASRAPLIDHLIELRSRLLKSVIALLIAFVICFYFAIDIFNILILPYEWAVGNVEDVDLIFTAPQEYFFTQVKLAFFGALFLAFPVIAAQVYMFVAPGLYRNERAAFMPYLVATPILFAVGAGLVYFVVMPLAMTFFLSMQQGGEGVAEIQYLGRTSEYLGLIMLLIFAFGIVFQLPVILTLMARAGFIGSNDLKRKRKYAIVIVFIMAAILTPPDPVTQIGLAVPALLLYEVSILLVKRIERKHRAGNAAAGG